MGWPVVDDEDVALQEGLAVNVFNAGAALSAVLCGHLIDRFGRKPALVVGSWLFAVGGILQTAAIAPWMLILGRLVAGAGVGITSSAGPAYISEIAPASIRGAMAGVCQSNAGLALIGAAVINFEGHDSHVGWRWSLSVQIFLGLVTAVGLLFVSDTPRFLESAGRSEEALRVLVHLRGGDQQMAESELAGVRQELEEERQAGSATWSEVFMNPHFRNVVLLGCCVQFFQIITGIDAIVSFGGTLFAALGVSGLASTLAPGVFFFIGNAIGSFGLADRLGRRPLLIWGMAGMSICMLVGGAVAYLRGDHAGIDLAGLVVITAVVSFMFFFGMSWGFGAWLYISEIMPLRIRGKAVGLCTGVNWGPANMLSAFVTPLMITSSMGPAGTLLFFGLLSAAVVPFAFFCIPETKGKTLEEITPMFRFTNCSEFCSFVRGNLRTGDGLACRIFCHQADIEKQVEGKQIDDEEHDQNADMEKHVKVENNGDVVIANDTEIRIEC